MRGALLRVEGRSRSRSAAWVCTVLEVCGRSGLLALARAVLTRMRFLSREAFDL